MLSKVFIVFPALPKSQTQTSAQIVNDVSIVVNKSTSVADSLHYLERMEPINGVVDIVRIIHILLLIIIVFLLLTITPIFLLQSSWT